MDDEHRAILKAATPNQRRYVMARIMGAPTKAAAARTIKMSKSAPSKWDNLDDLEEVITAIQIDQIDGAKWALSNLSLDAVKALRESLSDRVHRVPAANSILDRTGIPKQSTVDVTSGGEQIKATVYIPDNERD